MSEADEKRQRIKDKVAASQERLQSGGTALPELPSPARFPDAYPPEDYRTLAKEYPWLAVAAGMGAGLLLGAVLPKGMGSKLGKRAVAAATAAGELGLALSKQAGEKAADAGRDGATQLRGKASRIATPARTAARSAGMLIVREAIRLATRARK